MLLCQDSSALQQWAWRCAVIIVRSCSQWIHIVDWRCCCDYCRGPGVLMPLRMCDTISEIFCTIHRDLMFSRVAIGFEKTWTSGSQLNLSYSCSDSRWRRFFRAVAPRRSVNPHPTSRFNCSLEILVLACLFTLMQRIKRIFVTQNRHKNCHSATGVVVWVNKCGDWSKLIEQLTNQNIMWKMCSLVVTGK